MAGGKFRSSRCDLGAEYRQTLPFQVACLMFVKVIRLSVPGLFKSPPKINKMARLESADHPDSLAHRAVNDSRQLLFHPRGTSTNGFIESAGHIGQFHSSIVTNTEVFAGKENLRNPADLTALTFDGDDQVVLLSHWAALSRERLGGVLCYHPAVPPGVRFPVLPRRS